MLLHDLCSKSSNKILLYSTNSILKFYSRNQFISEVSVTENDGNKIPTATEPKQPVPSKARPPVAKKPSLKAAQTDLKSSSTIASAAVELMTSQNQKKTTEDRATQMTSLSTDCKPHVSG